MFEPSTVQNAVFGPVWIEKGAFCTAGTAVLQLRPAIYFPWFQ